jgi:hypothetical protein
MSRRYGRRAAVLIGMVLTMGGGAPPGFAGDDSAPRSRAPAAVVRTAPAKGKQPGLTAVSPGALARAQAKARRAACVAYRQAVQPILADLAAALVDARGGDPQAALAALDGFATAVGAVATRLDAVVVADALIGERHSAATEAATRLAAAVKDARAALAGLDEPALTTALSAMVSAAQTLGAETAAIAAACAGSGNRP